MIEAVARVGVGCSLFSIAVGLRADDCAGLGAAVGTGTRAGAKACGFAATARGTAFATGAALVLGAGLAEDVAVLVGSFPVVASDTTTASVSGFLCSLINF